VASLHEIAEELYGRVPDEFTEARTRAEKEARAGGDRELAKQVKALRRPALPAWAVNQLVRERADLVHQVVSLGESLREAQSLLQGNALRELTRQRRRLVAAVTAQVKEVAAERGQRLSDAATRQVEETLQAAMADPRAAEALASGLLAQPLSSTGLESLAEVLAVPLEEATTSGPSGPPTLTVVEDDARPLREAQERVDQAGKAVRKATKARDAARGKREKAQAKVLQVEAELEELRRRLAELEGRAEDAAEGLTELDGELEQAEAELAEAAAEAEAAAKELKRLRKR
jgi:DNA repair exonuclease SbcCD ATPase subunit